MNQLWLLILIFVPLTACSSTASSSSFPDATHRSESIRAISDLLDTLYQAVSFGPGEEGNWALIGNLVWGEGMFIQPFREGSPKVLNTEGFVQDFRQFIRESRAGTEGFHERIAARRIDVFDNIAHAYVVFESSYGDGSEEPKGRGLDSIQLVRHRDRWYIASITTAFERSDTPLPQRFLR